MGTMDKETKERIMDKEYKQLRDVKLQNILELDEGPFRIECLNRLEKCGFIEEKEPEWYEITMKDLHKIRGGITLKRVLSGGHESIFNVTSDPYWSSWQPEGYLSHILVCTIEEGSTHGMSIRGVSEYSINDLFNGKVYISK